MLSIREVMLSIREVMLSIREVMLSIREVMLKKSFMAKNDRISTIIEGQKMAPKLLKLLKLLKHT